MRRYTPGSRKLFCSLEAEEIVVTPNTDSVVNDDVMVTDVGTSVVGDGIDIAVQEITAADKALDQICDVTEALESMVLCFKECVDKEGGFNKQNMRAVNTAIEGMCNNVDILFSKNYSLESFSLVQTRAKATELALENIVDTIKEAFKKFIEMLKKAADWVMNFFRDVFRKAEITQKKAEEIQIKLKALSPSADTKETEMPAGSIGKALIYNGAFPTSFNAPLTELTKQFDDCVRLANGNLATFKNLKENMFKVVKVNIAKVEVTAVPEIINGFNKKAEISNLSTVSNPERYGISKGSLDERLSVKCSDGLIGGANLVRISNAVDLDGKDTLEIMAKTKLFVAHDKDCDKVNIEKIPVLKQNTLVEIIADVIKSCKDILAFKSLNEQIASFKSELVIGLEDISRVVFRDDAGRSAKSGIQNVSRYFINNLDQPIIGLCTHMLKVNNALLAYADKSIGMYK